MANPAHARFRFHGTLNDHLPPEQRDRDIEKQFLLPASAKDMIESLGIPHPEVDAILVNGEPSDFSRLIRNGDRVDVYPASDSPAPSLIHLQPAPPAEARFVLDVHLGRLAAYLRMLGFDTAYSNCATDPELVRISRDEHRILLTRDRGALKHSDVTHGYWLRETAPRLQTAEVVLRYNLAGRIRPLTRCMVCNTPLVARTKSEVAAKVPPKVLEWCNDFRQCPHCGRVYWEGSHAERMRTWIAELNKHP